MCVCVERAGFEGALLLRETQPMPKLLAYDNSEIRASFKLIKTR